MAIAGQIARRARAELPSSWDALARATSLYGETYLQDHIDDVKFQLFATVVNATMEDSIDRRVLRAAGKLVAVRIIPGAVDYWNDQKIVSSTTGTNEQESYPDRPGNLFKLYSALQKELNGEIGDILNVILGSQIKRRTATPTVDVPTGTAMVTPDPWLWPGPTAGSTTTA